MCVKLLATVDHLPGSYSLSELLSAQGSQLGRRELLPHRSPHSPPFPEAPISSAEARKGHKGAS